MQLLIFAPCEKVITDQQNNHTLVIIMQTVAVQFPPEAEVPINVMMPREWAVYTMWQPEVEDIGKKFVQKLECVSPDGQIPMKAPLPFEIKNDETHRNILNIVGFPIGQQGKYTLRMWLELESGEVATKVFTYTLTVSHQRVAQPVST